MSNLLIRQNSDITHDKDVLNIYLTEDRCTIRVLSPLFDGYKLVPLIQHQSMLNTHETLLEQFVYPADQVRNDRGCLYDYFKFITAPQRAYYCPSVVKDELTRPYYIITYEQSFSIDDIIEWDTNTEICVRIGHIVDEKALVIYDRLTHTHYIKHDNTNARMIYDSRYNNETFVSVCVAFSVYDRTLNFLSCPKSVKCNQLIISNIDFGVEMNATDEERELKELQWYNDNNLTLELVGSDTIESEGSETMMLRVLKDNVLYNINHEYNIEMIDGYCPYTRCRVVNGTGQFNITALGLCSGETMSIKINDGFYTSRAEKTLNVI